MNCYAAWMMPLVFLLLPVLTASAWGQTSFAEHREAELRLVTAVVDHFQCENARPQDAVAQLIRQALGAEKAVPVDWERFKNREGADEHKITLNLKKVPAHQVLTYIAELSGARWSIEGWSEAGMLTFRTLTEDNDESLMSLSEAVELTPVAVTILGLQPTATAAELERLFASLGVNVSQGSLFHWNAKDRLLGFRLNRMEMPFMRAITRLANSGRQVVKAG